MISSFKIVFCRCLFAPEQEPLLSRQGRVGNLQERSGLLGILLPQARLAALQQGKNQARDL